MWGKSTVEFNQFIAWVGLSLENTSDNIPDHISNEFDCMVKLIECEAQSVQDGNIDLTMEVLKQENWLLNEHLSKWIPQFCDNVIESASLPFYREIAVLTKSWVETDKEIVELAMSELTAIEN